METTQKIVHPDPVIHLATGASPGCILSHMIHIREATLDDIPDAADTLSLAFSDYAWTNWTVAPDRHVDRIRDIQRVCLEHVALPHGLIYVEDAVTAVIALVGPGAHGRVFADTWARIQSAAGNAPAHGSEVSLPVSPIAGSWELATVGVKPRHRGTDSVRHLSATHLMHWMLLRAPVLRSTWKHPMRETSSSTHASASRLTLRHIQSVVLLSGPCSANEGVPAGRRQLPSSHRSEVSRGTARATRDETIIATLDLFPNHFAPTPATTADSRLQKRRKSARRSPGVPYRLHLPSEYDGELPHSPAWSRPGADQTGAY